MMAPSINWYAAIVFYLLFNVGILVFVVLPSLKADSRKTNIVLGALFGLITYATYDLTSLATINNWSLIVTIVDMLWGTLLSMVVSFVSFMVG
jgi:uncharacterized membrane protein